MQLLGKQHAVKNTKKRSKKRDPGRATMIEQIKSDFKNGSTYQTVMKLFITPCGAKLRMGRHSIRHAVKTTLKSGTGFTESAHGDRKLLEIRIKEDYSSFQGLSFLLAV